VQRKSQCEQTYQITLGPRNAEAVVRAAHRRDMTPTEYVKEAVLTQLAEEVTPHQVRSTLRIDIERATGKQYPSLFGELAKLDVRSLMELRRLITDVKEERRRAH
jgi:hypothetical protein